MKTISNYYGTIAPENYYVYLGVEKDETFPVNPMIVGIEVEAERVGGSANHLDGEGFAVKEDHSLRNNGREVVTYPISADYAVPAFAKIVSNLGQKVEFTKRTSIHVHMDCTRLTMEQVLNIVYVYTLFEESLFGFCDPSRRRSIFCVPLTSFISGELDTLESMVSRWGKYSALNLMTLQTLGTVEFRHLEGTNDVEKFRKWVYLISRIYAYAISKPTNKLLETILKLNTNSNYYEFANDVFGDLLDIISRNLVENMVVGIRHLKTIKQRTKAFDKCYDGFFERPRQDRLKELAEKGEYLKEDNNKIKMNFSKYIAEGM